MKKTPITSIITMRKKRLDELRESLRTARNEYDKACLKHEESIKKLNTEHDRLHTCKMSMTANGNSINGKTIALWLEEQDVVKANIVNYQNSVNKLSNDCEETKKIFIRARDSFLKSQAKIDSLIKVANEQAKERRQKETRSEDSIGEDMFLVKCAQRR